LTGTGHYDLTYARDEFDIEEDLAEIVAAKENKQELNEVIGEYTRVLSTHITNKIEDYQDLLGRVEKKRAEELKQPEPSITPQLTQKIDKGLLMSN